ncbi:hypothetical protein L7F22_029803 [Adiantum nelumboides]|nr:hypothetical protein [Adiantum nelumboides]
MLKAADYVSVATTVRLVVQPRGAPYVRRVEPVEVMPIVHFVPMEVPVQELPMPKLVELVKEDEPMVKEKQCAKEVVGVKHQVQHGEVREPVFIELLSEKLATCSRVVDAQGWEIDKESEQSQDGGQVLVEQLADKNADIESTYEDDGDGSLSFWEISTRKSLEIEFTSYGKETSSDERELVRVKLSSNVHEDMTVCNVNENQVEPREENMRINILCVTMLMTMLVKVVVEHAMVVHQVQRSSRKEEATLAKDEQQLNELVVDKLPCDVDEVDPYWSVIEMESDEARLSGYACSYKDGEALDDMILDEMVWDEFISSLFRDTETRQIQDKQAMDTGGLAKKLLPLDLKGTWRPMEACVKLDLTNAIGVSKFSSKKTIDVLKFAKIPPTINKVVEMHPLWQQKQSKWTYKRLNIHVGTWSLLGAPQGS